MNKTVKRIAILVMSAALILSSCMTAFAGSAPAYIPVYVGGECGQVTQGEDYYIKETDKSFKGVAEAHVGEALSNAVRIMDITTTGNFVDIYGGPSTTGLDASEFKGDIMVNNVTVTDSTQDTAGIHLGSNADIMVNDDVTVSAKADNVYGIFGEGGIQAGNVTVENKDAKGKTAGIYVEGIAGITIEKNITVAGGDPSKREGIHAVLVPTKTGEGYVDVVVGGNVDADGGTAIHAKDATVMVEGMTIGEIIAEGNSIIYVGEVAEGTDTKDVAGFLVGSGKDIISKYKVDKAINKIESDQTPSYKTYFVVDKTAGNTFTISALDGSKITAVAGIDASAVKINADGSATITVPATGGMQDLAITLYMEPDPAPKKTTGGGAWTSAPVSAGSPAAPITNGTWSTVNGQTRYTVNGETLKNAKAWITFVPAGQTQPVTGCFYFDNSGNMAIGWQKIDGVWYYFDAVNAPTLGMLYVDRITPDGYRVDANGALVQ